MTALQQRIATFRLRLMLRIAGYAALLGLVVALVVVIAAPWLRDALGIPGYWLTIALPALFPALYVAYVLVNRPGERETVLAADAWCGAEGSIISAWELEREHPDSPFVRPIALRAIENLQQRRLPEPRLLRRMMVTMLVLLALVPFSRYVHAQMQKAEEQEKAEELARKVEVPPDDAEQIAKDAATAAEEAKKLKAKQQERLADDIEQAARNAQAGGQDKERALRDANSLVDRAKAQTEAGRARKNAREALEQNDITRDLAEAVKDADHERVRSEIDELTNRVYNEGEVSREAADRIREAVRQAQREAPQDARMRRAAENLERLLDRRTLDNAEKRQQEARERMQAEGMDPAAIEAALEKLAQVDKRALERALEELAKSASPLRDLDVSGREMEELLRQLETGQISPEDAKRMAEAAKQLSERLQIDAETLRELLQKGMEFEGLEDVAKRMVEGETPQGPGEIPEWAKDMIPPEWEEAWQRAQGEQGGTPGETGGAGDGEGDGPEKSGPTREVGGEGEKEGVDTTDTGRGEKDPDSDHERLDPDKAKEESASRTETGREAGSKGINTREEEERLPRRYRDAARKYFER